MVGIIYSLISPAVVIRPTLPAEGKNSVNHSAPSGPFVIPMGELPDVGTVNSVSAPDVVMRPILLVPYSVNQSAPSAPDVMEIGLEPAGRGYSVIVTDWADESAPTLSSNNEPQIAQNLALGEKNGKQLRVGMATSGLA
jgi:hypothetical protein